MKLCVNSPCHCGSGKKYKKCCKPLKDGRRTLNEKIRAGEIPFFVRVSSSEGAAGQISIHSASVTIDGRRTVLLEDEVTLTTNSSEGDKTDSAVAVMSIPIVGDTGGAIKTFGNASVSNGISPSKLSLSDGQEKIKVKSQNGLFAEASIKTQRNTDRQYFDLLFGTAGQRATTNQKGVKPPPHSHFSFYPDGNGKFARLSGHRCELSSEMTYNSSEKAILPQTIRVHSLDHQETLELHFTQQNADHVVLNEMSFVDSKLKVELR